jgi:fibronectin-binding autotransporter adhesin
MMKNSYILTLGLLPLAVQSAFAANGTTTGAAANANFNWNTTTTAPWTSGIVADGAGFTANFTAELTTATRVVTITTASKTIGNITFTDGASSTNDLTIAASAGLGLTLDNGGSSPILNVTQGGARRLTISAPVSGSNGFTKTGAGILFLSNTTAANDFTGLVTLNGGKLQLNSDANLGNVNNDISVISNSGFFNNTPLVTLNANRSITLAANLEFNGFLGNDRTVQVNGAIGGTGNISLTDATSNLILAGANTFAGSISIAAGGQTTAASNHTTLTVGTGTADNASTLGNSSNAVSLGGFSQVTEGVATQNGSSVLRFNRNDYNFSGNITGSGIVEVNPGDTTLSVGSVITLSGTNTYTGQTNIRQGALRVDSAAALSSNSNLSFNGAGVLLIGGDLDSGNPADFTRGVGTGAGQVQWTNGGGGFAAVGANRTVDIGGAGASLPWSDNSIYLGHQDADSKVTIVNDVALSGTGNRDLRVLNGTAAIDGEVSGDITGTGVGIQKNETGTLLLSGNSTYDGTTLVNAGTLLVNGSLGNTAVTVGSATAATLGGSGSIDGSITVAANGILAPGNSAGMLTLNNTLTLGGVLALEINGLTAGSLHDQVALNSSGVLGGTLSLAWSLLSPAALSTELVLIANDGSDAFTGAFSNAADLSTVNDNLGNSWQVRYAGGTGNDLTLVAIPEPGAAVLGLLGSMALLRRRRS